MKRPHNKYNNISSRKGFTLLELLISMTLLLVMVGFLAVAFNSASVAWQQGEKDVDRFSQARATIDLMTRDLRQAIVSTNLPFYAYTNGIAFVAPVNADPNSADLAEIVYVLNWNDPTVPPTQQNFAPFKLYRRLTKPTDTQWSVYSNPLNWPATSGNSSLVCDSIINFAVTCYYTNGNSTASFWNSTPKPSVWNESVPGLPIAKAGDGMMTNIPPGFINIHLEVLDSKTARLLTNFPVASAAYVNLTNKARAFDAYIQIPHR
jgi:prepilin-type N-terminal cleavage/methylation domain-containing protein